MGCDGQSVFTDAEKRSKADAIHWSTAPDEVSMFVSFNSVLAYPFVVGSLPKRNGIEIRNISAQTLAQTEDFGQPKLFLTQFIQNGVEEREMQAFCVASTDAVWLLIPVPAMEQVNSLNLMKICELVEMRQFFEAISILDLVPIENKVFLGLTFSKRKNTKYRLYKLSISSKPGHMKEQWNFS